MEAVAMLFAMIEENCNVECHHQAPDSASERLEKGAGHEPSISLQYQNIGL